MFRACVCVCVCAGGWRRILVKCVFILKVASDGQDLPDNALLPPSSVFFVHLSFRHLSTLSLPLCTIPRLPPFFSLWSLTNRMLNLETYFSKSPGLEKRKATHNITHLIHVLSSLINGKLWQKPSLIFFNYVCLPIKRHWPPPLDRGPH